MSTFDFAAFNFVTYLPNVNVLKLRCVNIISYYYTFIEMVRQLCINKIDSVDYILIYQSS